MKIKTKLNARMIIRQRVDLFGTNISANKISLLQGQGYIEREYYITAPKTCFNNFFSDVRDQEGGTFSKREIKNKVLNPESVIVLTKNFKSCHKFLSRFYGVRRRPYLPALLGGNFHGVERFTKTRFFCRKWKG